MTKSFGIGMDIETEQGAEETAKLLQHVEKFFLKTLNDEGYDFNPLTVSVLFHAAVLRLTIAAWSDDKISDDNLDTYLATVAKLLAAVRSVKNDINTPADKQTMN